MWRTPHVDQILFLGKTHGVFHVFPWFFPHPRLVDPPVTKARVGHRRHVSPAPLGGTAAWSGSQHPRGTRLRLRSTGEFTGEFQKHQNDYGF